MAESATSDSASGRVQRALISVSDKTGLVDFARGLESLGVEILSTGGTARALKEAGVSVIDVADHTGSPEILDGRVKTLHPKVHGGILFRRDDPAHRQTVEEHGIGAIDMVVVNLYPFVETIRRPGVTREEAIEQIDIGGPSMVRSAAKNHRWVTIVCQAEYYPEVLETLNANNGATTLELRERLAGDAYRHTSEYDAAIATYLAKESDSAASEDKQLPSQHLPTQWVVSLSRSQKLRYGENPHQAAGFYGDLDKHFEQLHGKELSYNNILDLSAAVELIEEFPAPESAAMAIIKHTNPCGIALGKTLGEAWERALACDQASANGGIVALNRPLDMQTATLLHPFFTEIIAAPDFDPASLALLREKKNRRVLRMKAPLSAGEPLRLRSAAGGLLVQEADQGETDPASLRVVTRRQPTDVEMQALLFAWRVVKHLKSNAIAFTSANQSLGLGAGQMSRVDAARIAALKAGQAELDLENSAVASDAFFPFADGLIVCAEAGARAVIQPGGSVRDDEVIAAADERDLTMVFTGARHFRH